MVLILPKLDTSSGAMHIIDESIAVKPAILNTWFIKSIKFALQKAMPKTSLQTAAEMANKKINVSQDGSLSESSESGASTTRSEGEKLPKHQPAVKAGGKRKKGGRK